MELLEDTMVSNFKERASWGCGRSTVLTTLVQLIPLQRPLFRPCHWGLQLEEAPRAESAVLEEPRAEGARLGQSVRGHVGGGSTGACV